MFFFLLDFIYCNGNKDFGKYLMVCAASFFDIAKVEIFQEFVIISENLYRYTQLLYSILIFC